ncbi:MAG: hypothetical protein AMXMBFR36_18200 [Acidobacteriota bacterium]
MSARSREVAIAAAALLGFAVAPVVAQLPAVADARIETAAGIAPRDALARHGRGDEPAWVAWSVPTVAGTGELCCFDGFRDGAVRHRGCSLDGRDRGWGSHDDGRPGVGRPTEMLVFAEAGDRGVTRWLPVSPGCPVDGAGRRVVWLGAVAPAASLAALEATVDGGDADAAETAIAVAAHHADAGADQLLERIVLDRGRGELREDALFWAGHLRGERGLALIDRILANEPDRELREHALFAATQSEAPGALDRVRRAAVDDRDPEVRGQALFWLAQSDDPGAGDWILGRLDAERDPEVREQAVFALSQLDDGADQLLALLSRRDDPELVRQAIFWLGQSDDPRALAKLEALLAD